MYFSSPCWRSSLNPWCGVKRTITAFGCYFTAYCLIHQDILDFVKLEELQLAESGL